MNISVEMISWNDVQQKKIELVNKDWNKISCGCKGLCTIPPTCLTFKRIDQDRRLCCKILGTVSQPLSFLLHCLYKHFGLDSPAILRDICWQYGPHFHHLLHKVCISDHFHTYTAVIWQKRISPFIQSFIHSSLAVKLHQWKYESNHVILLTNRSMEWRYE